MKITIKRLKKRKKQTRLEDLPFSSVKESFIENLSLTLTKQIDKDILKRKYAPVSAILKLVGAGVFLGASLAFPNLPRAVSPFLTDKHEYNVWKRFNIPYLKRTLQRLEKQKLVNIKEQDNCQIVEITDSGRRKILKYAIDELAVEKPKYWDKKWRLMSYDIPEDMKFLRDIFRDYLQVWGFYPLHESMFLHAWPCEKQVEFLREYLGISEYVRFFLVTKIENDIPFRQFFGI